MQAGRGHVISPNEQMEGRKVIRHWTMDLASHIYGSNPFHPSFPLRVISLLLLLDCVGTIAKKCEQQNELMYVMM